ncbi:Ricin-type beta-trefoil lectin domain-containing protein [Saccharopolyspora antimicrobica]|uniref:Ricin-type beta-trefoil lectin domain-containing protein n=1 Tax=Saccharopolyspora antimicrobica TaxID=455193 RepID=A0A1I4T4I4_9PSEU|nr:Ricin-type beta-trefoil lectin domain-containing protein [Saccharopolyspora antimicrobica]
MPKKGPTEVSHLGTAFARYAVVGAAAVSLAAAVALPASAATSAELNAAATGSKCLDVGSTRNNGDKSHLWDCGDRNNNQKFAIDGSQIRIVDTIGTRQEMCLDAGNTRNNGDKVHLWRCGDTNKNQKWVVQRGQIKIEDTL